MGKGLQATKLGGFEGAGEGKGANNMCTISKGKLKKQEEHSSEPKTENVYR